MKRFGVDNVDGVVVGASDEEASVVGDLHVVGIHADVQRADNLVGGGVDDADGFAGPVGDEETLAVGSENDRSWVNVHGNAGKDGAGLHVEDDDVAGAIAGAAVGRVKKMTAGQKGCAGPPDELGIDGLDQVCLGLLVEAAVLVVELVDGCGAASNVFGSSGVAAGDKKGVTVGRPGHAEPDGLEGDVLDLFLGLGVDDDDAVG